MTSDHLCSGYAKLSALLNEGDVAIHSFIIGELTCGNLKNRLEIISLRHRGELVGGALMVVASAIGLR